MKAELFLIKGSIALLKAIMQELVEAGYKNLGTDIKGKFICQGHAISTYDCTDKKDRFIDIGVYDQSLPRFDFKSTTFELPQQYDEALAFAKEQLEDKYWVKTPQKWGVGTFVVFIRGYGDNPIGTISTIVAHKSDTVINVNTTLFKEGASTCNLTKDYECKWFATRKEAEEFAETLKPEPVKAVKFKFKVGDYICTEKDSYGQHIGKITSIGDNVYNYWVFNVVNEYREDDFYNLKSSTVKRLATEDEIKWFISFGCANGTLAEAKAILKAFN